jgi:hypothetical protein
MLGVENVNGEELLYVKLETPRLLILLLSSLSFSGKMNCICTKEGITFIVNETNVVEMNAYITCKDVLEYNLLDTDLQFCIDTNNFRQCLNLLGDDTVRDSNFSFMNNTNYELIHYRDSGSLKIKLNNDVLSVDCELSLYTFGESIDMNYLFLQSPTIAKCILPVY